jgi:putative glutamine amidotransferase
MTDRPLVAIPARFSDTASAHRHRALSTARALSAGVLLAGGEPLTVHPWAPAGSITTAEVGERLSFADAVLLPGGGDLAPQTYGADLVSAEVYDVDAEQDAFDLAVATWALEEGVPLLAVCRGWQVVNVALGGTLEQHMPEAHRHVVHQVSVEPGSLLADAVGTTVTASCSHHQRVNKLGTGLVPAAYAEDGTVEGAVLPEARGWFLAVQWHPEDTVETDPAQRALFEALTTAAPHRKPRAPS